MARAATARTQRCGAVTLKDYEAAASVEVAGVSAVVAFFFAQPLNFFRLAAVRTSGIR